jgi:ribonuclease J
LALIHVSAQNIDRLVSIFRACLKTNRILLIDLYTAMILEATGNPKIPQSDWDQVALCIPQSQRLQIKRNQWFYDLKRHSNKRVYLNNEVAANPGNYVLLFRNLWMDDLDASNVLADGCFIHSQWEGYLSAQRFLDVKKWREEHQLPFFTVHTSGHASLKDLRRFVASLAPKVLIPIHTEVPERYCELYPHVAIRADGEFWDV